MQMRLFTLFLLSLSFIYAAQNNYEVTLPTRALLWPEGAPNAQGNLPSDQPQLTVYPSGGPQKVNTGVIVFPGGGYQHLSMDLEGSQVAAWLNSYGITAFVLRYRLGPKYHYPVELKDGQRAVRWVRLHAADYKIDPQKIGVWGFSAGGHLAALAGTKFDGGKQDSQEPIEQKSSRPDFLILAYPVITFQEPYLHRGSRTNLIGTSPDQELIQLTSNELHVTKDTPPTFLFHTSDDGTVPVQNSLLFYQALRAAGVDAEMHIFEHGKHGVGLARDIPDLSVWPNLLAAWLHAHGWQ
jgi:acetyl esterase/lipase